MSAEAGLLPHQTPEYMAANRGVTVISVIVSISAISTLFVAARIFSRTRLAGRMFLDDWLVLVSAISQWICVGFATYAASKGNGRHIDTLKPEDLSDALLFTMLNFPFGIVGFGLPKVAVVSLLVRILNPDKTHRYFLWALSLTCFIVLLGCTPILFAQCSPAYAQWDVTFPREKMKCWPKSVLVNYATVAGSLSAFTDLYLAAYPAVVLWGLQMNIKKKIALCIALGIGSISTVVAIYKCTRLPSLAEDDFTWATADLVIWTVVEAAVIIIACCIPILQPLVDICCGRRTLAGSSKGYRHYGSSRDGSGHIQSRDIELEKRGAKYPKGITDVSRIHGGDFDDEYLRTRVEGENSQESILRISDEDQKKPIETKLAVKVRGGNNYADEATVGDAGIRRTDVVEVSYTKDDARAQKGRKKWGAIGGI